MITQIILWGSIYATILALYLLLLMKFNPRLVLQDYPEKIKSLVEPKTKTEEKQSKVMGIGFLFIMILGPILINIELQTSFGPLGFWQIYWISFIVFTMFNFVDLVVLDLIIFHWITPHFLRINGAEQKYLYEGKKMHFIGFGIGSLLALISSLIISLLMVLFIS